MSDREATIQCRVAYLEGIMEGIRLYAVWKDGEQRVGVMQTQLKEVLAEYQSEIDKLKSLI